MSFFKPDSKCGLFRYDTLSWSLDFLLLYTKKITPRKQNFSAAKAIKAKVENYGSMKHCTYNPPPKSHEREMCS